MDIIEKFLEYIFIPTCGICGKLEKEYLCPKCEKELAKYIIAEKDYITMDRANDKKEAMQKQLNIEKMHILKYEDLVRRTIINFKFNDKPYLYKMFSKIILKNEKAFNFLKTYDIIIPVPMYGKKKRKRGFNQSELIAREIARKANLDIYTDVLIKTKDNKTQSSLTKEERSKNVKNVYKLANEEKINNKNILLFDDIYTTGATTGECVKIISKAKVNKIGILTLAKD